MTSPNTGNLLHNEKSSEVEVRSPEVRIRQAPPQVGYLEVPGLQVRLSLPARQPEPPSVSLLPAEGYLPYPLGVV